VVQIRPLVPEDAGALLDLLLANRSFLSHWDPKRPESFWSLEGQRGDLLRADADRASGRAFGFAVLEAADGRLVGRVNLSNVVRGAWQNATLGYYVGEAWNGRGFASRAVDLALNQAFGPLDLHRVQAGAMPRNVRSIRVLEKNGFRFEGLAVRYLKINGVWEDHRLYAITREDRQAGRA
jgi:[ribosomal protein S5]-alanine N-acetyltransferase